jgi:hypothetical protein
VYGANLVPAHFSCVLESVTQNSLAGISSNKLDTLNHTVNENMLYSAVLSLSVFSDQNGVDIVPGCLVSLNRLAWPDIGEEIERATKGKVKRDMAFAYRCCKRAFQSNIVLADTLDSLFRNNSASIFELGGDVNRLPFNRNLYM